MPTQKFIIGLDIGGTKTAVALWEFLDEHYRVKLIDKEKFATQGSFQQVFVRICASITKLIASAKITREHIAGIGISCGGPLNSREGLILSPPNLPTWDAIPITKMLTDEFGIACYLENDANACALAEWHWGAGRGAKNMIFLTFGTGMGAGLILDQKLYRGSNDLAGEVGHLRLASDGPIGFGKVASFEGFCSGGGIARLAQMRFGLEKTAKEICELAQAGDSQAKAVIEESARYLGLGLALLIDILNPDCIVIGSIFQRAENLFRPTMETIIKSEAIAASVNVCKIVPAELGDTIGDYAALGIVIEKIRHSNKEE